MPFRVKILAFCPGCLKLDQNLQILPLHKVTSIPIFPFLDGSHHLKPYPQQHPPPPHRHRLRGRLNTSYQHVITIFTHHPHFAGQVMVGPLTVKEAKPLPLDLEEFVSNSGGEGFIIVSFGSNVGTLSQTAADTLAEAFGKLKQQVVWKLQGN